MSRQRLCPWQWARYCDNPEDCNRTGCPYDPEYDEEPVEEEVDG